MTMQLTEKFIDDKIIDDIMDDILKEAADGYGDLIAAALVHKVSVRSLQTRVVELRNLRVAWIS
jgi:hypothetical protein